MIPSMCLYVYYMIPDIYNIIHYMIPNIIPNDTFYVSICILYDT